MSNQQSACVPPPSDYTPRAKPPQTKYRERGGHRGGGRARGNRRGYSSYPAENLTAEDKLKNQPKDKFHRNEDDDYFAHVQDEEDQAEQDQSHEPNDDEDDPLDAYMKSLGGAEEETVTSEKDELTSRDNNTKGQSEEPETSGLDKKRGVRLDIDNTDDLEESYYKYVEQAAGKKVSDSAEEGDERQNLVDYDHDGNIVGVRKVKKEVDPLPPLDHSKIIYEAFERNFYQEHAEIQKLTPDQQEELRTKLEIKVSGKDPPKPVCSFAHFRFDEQLMRVIRRSDYTQPTPIQAQAIPAALLGRNVIGIAMTGSGKTAAYLWPMIVHIMGQPDLKKGDGPIGLVLVPTRELALQVYSEAKKFSSSYKIAVVCAYGGGSKYEQSRDLELGAEIVVATPGRLIDLIKMGVTNLKRVTYLVLDEADRFFEMGFELQVRSICDHIRPDRQTLLFSATFRKRIEQLARTVTDNPIKIVQKTIGEVNEDVRQHVVILSGSSKKWDWLLKKLVEFLSSGSILIFVTRIVNSEELHNNLRDQGTETLLLHGDMEQSERNRVITAFKRKEKTIMIATDVAARGLDISHIRTVINYDVARDIDTHIHRVGRTGRAGLKGDAYTLMTEKDKDFAGHLVKNLESSQQDVDKDLLNLAMQSHSFRNSRGSHPARQHQNYSGQRGHHRSHEDGSRGSSSDHYQRHHCRYNQWSGNSGQGRNHYSSKRSYDHDHPHDQSPSDGKRRWK